MGDFVLDFRTRQQRSNLLKAAAFLKFLPQVATTSFHCPDFSLLLTSVDQSGLWGPYESEDLLVALCGRVALEEDEWRASENLSGQGGLAAKFIATRFREYGPKTLTALNGNFALMLCNKRDRKVYLVTDPAGACPVFKLIRGQDIVFSSHPDALAIATGEDQNWDETSLADFALGSVVTPPFTFYKSLRSVEQGRIIEISCGPEIKSSERTYFNLEFVAQEARTENELVEEFADAFKTAVRLRSLPRFGPTALALSGGLDSRTILAAAPEPVNLYAFCCFNAENYEFSVARSIARTADVEFVPLARSFDYYGENAELGVRIAGGMGSIANNHFLGVSARLEQMGTQNFLTGCYCDYLYKGLVLNRQSCGLFGREELAPFKPRFYFQHYRLKPGATGRVEERWLGRFPPGLRQTRDARSIFELEKRRTFPLWHEGDNAQRLVPQRVMHSFVPMADRGLLNVYCKMPYQYKLNRSLFKKAAARICGPRISRIPDANTGAPVDASLLREALTSSALRVKRKLQRLKPRISTDTSWPDWHYYVSNSALLKELWQRPNPAADDFFKGTLLPEDLRASPAQYEGRDTFFFVALLTLKIWFEQRREKHW